MSTTEPNRQFEELKQKLLKGIEETFPVVDHHTGVQVRVRNLEVQDSHLQTDDIKGQMDARLSGRSYTAPVTGLVEIADRDGKVLVGKRMKIADIPKLTRHYTFIHGGQEKTVFNQWRLRSGAYVKKTEREGEFEAQFQLAKGRSFDVQMAPDSSYLFVKTDARKIPLYSVLKASGVSDDEMKKAWGDKAYKATYAKSRYDKDLVSFYTSMKHGAAVPEGTDVPDAILKYFETTKMDPAVTKITLGAPHDKLSGQALLAASAKLIDVSGGRVRPDPLDSLEFKELWTPADHFADRLSASRTDIHSRVTKSIGRVKTQEAILAGKTSVLRDVMMPDLLQKPINMIFATALSAPAKQTNPVSMLADHTQTTIMGPGGIMNEHQVTQSNTSVDPSHLGFLDPVFTPEGSPGTVTHLAAGVTVKDRKPYSKFFNLETKKIEELTPAEATRAMVVLPDQVKWHNGVPNPLSPRVRVSTSLGEIEEHPFTSAKYVMISPVHVFSTESNLVPFMQNDGAARSTMSARHMAQAISVVEREAPLVQVQAAPGVTFEQRVGNTFLSHVSPVNGKITKIDHEEAVVRGADGASHSIHLYDHYPTNDKKGMLHSTALLKVGDSVKAGQAVADNSFTKGGVLALGTNLRVAYLANGSNHEDGLVLSESGAHKLRSVHLLKPSLYTSSEHTISKSKYLDEKSPVFKQAQYDKVGDDGIVKVGQMVHPGDPLILALKEEKNPDVLDTKMLDRLSKKGRLGFQDAAVVWDSAHVGEVIRVVKAGKSITVHVKTQEPLIVGSKVSTRHSAKGIVADIKPDAEMPYYLDAKGTKQHVQMLINPVSVPGRMNPGQILETAAAKIAEKTGTPYIVKNFDGKTDYLQKVNDELAKNGLKSTEKLIDPKTGRVLGDVTVGPHYAFQLEHQIDKKSSVRHGGGYLKAAGIPLIQYDTNMSPRGGGKSGAQSIGALGVYAALASGMKEGLGEIQTLKSDKPQAEALWASLTNGTPLPPPEVPFTYKKFGALMQASGLNLEKRGSKLQLIPQTDEETVKWAGGPHGEVRDAALTVAAKNMKPKSGGIFDPNIFGADKQGWGYLKLAAPMPNPIFAKAISAVLDLPDKRAPHAMLEKILSGEEKINGETGGEALKKALQKINIDAEMKSLRKHLDNPKLVGSEFNNTLFAYKSLRALKEQGKHPADVYMMQMLPVLPPIYRPFQEGVDQQDRIDPLNQLYRRVGMVNSTLIEQKAKGIPDKHLRKGQADLFREMQNLIGTTPKGKQALDIDFKGNQIRGRTLPGIMHTISGDKPKDGFFQGHLINKKQDYSARATIVADPSLSPDEVGVPKKIAFELFRPMIGHALVRMGMDPIQAQKEVSQRSSVAEAMLYQEAALRPVLLKRDPVLHQYGVIGQRVKITNSRAIKVNPLILPPLNGDIDGDQVALMLPISPGSVKEAYKMLPSNRAVSVATGSVLFTPTNEASLALYRMATKKRDTTHSFPGQAEAEKMFNDNKINLDDGITVGGVHTTLGRVRIAHLVPEKYKKEVLSDFNKPMSKKYISDLLKDTVKTNLPAFAPCAEGLMRLGFKMAYESGHTVALKDLEPRRKERDAIIAAAAKSVIGKSDEERTKIWVEATRKIHDDYTAGAKLHPTNVSDMWGSGIKARKEQIQGLVMAPMLVEDHLGNPSKVPVVRSFAEGLDVGGYFLSSAGARRGVIVKVDAVRDPGVLTKELIHSNIDSPITSMDCGTSHGISLSSSDHDLVDRYLVSPVNVGGTTVHAGTLITPEIQSSLAKHNISSVFVRSPLKCRMPHGICSRCMGAHPGGDNYHIGDNVGIAAAQALGERSTQLMMRVVHNQGIVPVTRGVVGDFDAIDRIYGAAKKSPQDAVVAKRDGKITRVEAQPQGGWDIHYEGSKTPMYSRQKPHEFVKPGHAFKMGDQLTEGDPNVHTLLATRGIEATQDWMTKRVAGIYAKEDILRRHVELTIRNATGTVKIADPGDHPSVLRGDHMQKSVVDEINSTTLQGKRPIKMTPILKSIETTSSLKQHDWMARLQTNHITDHVIRAATHGEKSDIHGINPIAGLAFGQEFGQGQTATRY